MSTHTVGREALDISAHAASAFIVLCAAWLLGARFTPAAAIVMGWAYGFVREFTEWQDGGNHPFTRWGLLDQAGWTLGAVGFVGLMHVCGK
jgi:hypothetical protein